jgi:hypothetical protein
MIPQSNLNHLIKNHFVKNQREDKKISGRSLCRVQYLWHFGIFTHEPQKCLGMKELSEGSLGSVRE